MFTGYSTVSSVDVLWLMMMYFYFFLFDKDSCVFHPISLSGLLHGIVGVKFSCSFCCCDVFRCCKGLKMVNL